MGKVIRTLANPASPRSLQAVVETVTKQFGGHIGFGNANGLAFGTASTNTVANQDQTKNLDGWIATGVSAGAGVAFTVTHNLPRIPIGFIMIRQDAPDILFDSGVAWTAATPSTLGTISLKANNGGNRYTIFII
jgi:hypothetical protein